VTANPVRIRGLAGVAARVAAGVLLACAATAVSAQPVPQCLERTSDARGTDLRNLCDRPISVAVCDAGSGPPGTWIRPCGDGSTLNVYFTEGVALDPGGRTRIELPTLKVAVCNGQGAVTGIGGFKSDATGRFTCPNRPPTARNAHPDTVQASTTESQARACAMAREPFAAADRAPGDCDCVARPAGAVTVHACSARGRLPERSTLDNALGGLRELLDELVGCDPLSDAGRCERRQMTNPGGVRG